MAKSLQGVNKLLTAMRKLSNEVNDQEICRRLETLINTEKDDLNAQLAKKIFETPDEVEPRDIPEPYTQYVMHYVYMLKREARLKEKEGEFPVVKKKAAKKNASRKTTAKKKSKKTSRSTAK